MEVRRGTGLDMPSRYAVKHSHEIFGQSTVVDPSCAITSHFSSIRSNKSEKLSIVVALRNFLDLHLCEEEQQRRISAKRQQNKFEKCAFRHEAPLVAGLKRQLPARRSVSASTLPLIKTSGQSSTAMISSRMAASEKNSASSPAMANSNIIDFQLLHSKNNKAMFAWLVGSVCSMWKGFPPPPPLPPPPPPLIMALQVRFVEGSQVEVPFQSNDSGTIDHGDDVDDDYDHEYNNHRESFSLYEEDGSTSAMKMSHFIRRISLYNPIVSGGDDVDPNKQPIKMGTFVGVFMPCIQNIFGVLFFIRLAWIVGTAGVLQGFLITFICCLVTFTTCISLSAIATNGMVPAGGPYYMISRNLGPELGGAVGILFYFASTIAASMYLLGMLVRNKILSCICCTCIIFLGSAEIFLLYTVPQAKIFDDIYNCYRLIGTLLLAIVSCIVLAGVGVVNRFALPTIALVNGCILLTFIGFFININGSDSLKFCMVGDRIPNLQHWIDNNPGHYLSCNETDLRHLFCANVTETGSCDPYFLKSANEGTIKEMNAITGATSGIILDNLFSKYLDTNDFIQSNDSKMTNNEYEETSDTYVVADMASSFTILIGVFFPSVTGIMQGSNRSGNLRDASRSIPVGTLAAQIITSIACDEKFAFEDLLGVLCFGASMNGMFLRDKFGAGAYGRLAAAELAVPHPMVIVIGSFIASAGAGMQCLTGAPRLLQAIALDGVIPMLHYFQKSTKRGEPLRAIFVSIAICELFILIAFLESITALISQFFLMCYLSVNAACVLQSVLKAPSWRPRFRFYHWSLSMFGAGLCVAVMFMSHWIFACVAIIIGMIAYKYIEYRGAEKEWGDGIRGLRLAAASYALTNLEEGPVHTKNWRPQLLVLCTVSSDRTSIENEQIVAFASQLKAGKGLTVLASVLNGKFLNMLAEVAATKMIMKEVCRRMKIRGFCEVLVAGDITEGMSALVQTSGLGGLKHNTVIMSWPQKWRNGNFEAVKFVETIRLTTAAKSALVVIKDVQQFPSNKEKIVGCMDVWWILHDGGIMILLAFLLRQNRVWRNTKLRIFTVCQSEEDLDKVRESMKTFIYHLRMDATVDVVCLTKYDISEYAHELTLKREQRQKMLDQLGLSDRQKDIDVDNAISNSTSGVQSGAELPVQNRTNLLTLDNLFKKDKTNEGNEATSNTAAEQCEEEKLPITSSQTYNIRCLQRAKKLNEAIQSRSRESDLIFLNLPDPGKNGYEKLYMEYIEVMTTGLNRVVLIKGTGSEVVTIFS
ncbi:Solute carrier family 12 member 6 [Trichinella britovi]|uniref:Solute carrier family 12 member 6 n=1 Tax=Trichinella britovi TaxID=45882 RepID=A0A0V1D396_TRIBR|nr:Solute carrier family 12 member 6 [Trichinella britovi]